MNANFIIKKSTSNQFYFNLTATNGKVIATSEMYESKQACYKGINSIKANAEHADVIDRSYKSSTHADTTRQNRFSKLFHRKAN